MIFFRRGPLVRSGTPREMLFRTLGLLIVFGVVVWLFWLNSEFAMKQIEQRGMIADMVDGLEKEDHRIIREFAKHFKEEYGVEIKVLITGEELVLPPLDGKTIFIGVNPSEKRAILELPVLVKKALGEDTLYSIQNQALQSAVDGGNWQEGILQTLDAVWRELPSSSGATP